ncbi:N-ATPase, AtpR subunit [Puniceibacterium sediminis]|uniref:N-ATPase, AtpR subunit n=2 Tax=Puniceibacterium sediminis TaxID=1608407 RepID=A0A238Y074_9RHOB|nr:N-ATPase, AtpR subunit [Puniceibacterium sediminis]
MMDLSALPLSVTLPACFLGGLAIGYVYFRALRHTAELIVSQGSPLLGLALTLGRLALLTAAFYVAVLAGGFALLAALAGVLCAKAVMLRHARRDRA